jgi:prepilin-type N-terminal cleavage/methylation domain-containing protein
MTNPNQPRRVMHRPNQLTGDTNVSSLSQPRSRRHRGFSMVEMLIALTISAVLMTATLGALDASFQQYKSTTESASTHVVSRIAMHRMLSMIRTGIEFGPFPTDVYSPSQNPVVSDYIEFVSERDLSTGRDRITRIELRPGTDPNGPGELWYVLIDNTPSPDEVDDDVIVDDGVVEGDDTVDDNIDPDPDADVNPDVDVDSTILDQRLLIPGVQNVTFTLRYNRQTYALDLATIDMTIAPNDSQDLRIGAVGDPAAPQTIRLVASAAPRQKR